MYDPGRNSSTLGNQIIVQPDGTLIDFFSESLAVKNSNNAVVYYLCFSSQKPVAQKIIESIFAKYR